MHNRRVVAAVMLLIVLSMCTGCNSLPSNMNVANENVQSGMEEYILEKYGETVDIKSVSADNMGYETEYSTLCDIGDYVVKLTQKCSQSGDYGAVEDDLLGTIVSDNMKTTIHNAISSADMDGVMWAYPIVEVPYDVSFGKVPTADEILDVKSKTCIGSVKYLGIVYADSMKVYNSLKPVTKVIQKVANKYKKELSQSFVIYIVPEEHKDLVSTYLEKNDIVRMIALFNSQENERYRVSDKVIKLNVDEAIDITIDTVVSSIDTVEIQNKNK